jgi:hypothetical protein
MSKVIRERLSIGLSATMTVVTEHERDVLSIENLQSPNHLLTRDTGDVPAVAAFTCPLIGRV